MEEYALQPVMTGDTTHLSPASASLEVLKRDGRWVLGAYQGYVHNQLRCTVGVRSDGR